MTWGFFVRGQERREGRKIGRVYSVKRTECPQVFCLDRMAGMLSQIPTPKVRWFQFRLRTMLIGMALLSVPCAWVGYSLNWIRQRHAALDARRVWDFSGSARTTAPCGLWLFGEPGVIGILCSPEDYALARGLFPEATVSSLESSSQTSTHNSEHSSRMLSGRPVVVAADRVTLARSWPDGHEKRESN